MKLGKRIGGAVYGHKTIYRELSVEFPWVKDVIKNAPDFVWNVIKIVPGTKSVTLIFSKDWDTAYEPEVTRYATIKNGAAKNVIPKKKQVYHHKWMFVKPNYRGFDYKESKMWSGIWQHYLPKHISKSKIGWKKYWEEDVLPLIERAIP